MRHAVLLLLGWTLWGLPAPAAAQEAPLLIDLVPLAAEDPEAALARTEAALAAASKAQPPDLRLIRDLLAFRAELQPTPGALEALGGFLVQHRARLGDDPAPTLRAAAQAYEAAGDVRGARRLWGAVFAAERDAGASSRQLAQLQREIARLAEAAGATAAAQAATLAAEALAGTTAGLATGTRGDGTGYRSVDVYYGTDRARSGERDPRRFYGHGRGSLDLGVAQVTIPDTHRPGQIEAPSIWRLEFSENPAKHVVLSQVTPLESAAFYSRLRAEFDGRPPRDAFVFIHGYNVTFEAAAKRAAQIAHDMEFPGVPILYSWPSRGSTLWYGADAAVVRLSGRRLAGFLDDLLARSGARTVHIVAHSMGNRALTDALENLALAKDLGPGDAPLFGQVLFAAPDVDAGLFAAMAETFRPIAKRLTLYASENDWALVSSRKLHGDAPRAGQGGADLLAERSIDSIDMSALGEDMLAHSYFADDSSAIADMMTLFWQNPPPARRCGLVARSGAPVWDYAAGRCASRDLIPVLATLQHEGIADLAGARAALGRLTDDPDTIAVIEPALATLFGP